MLNCDLCNLRFEDGSEVFPWTEEQVKAVGAEIDPFWGTFIVCPRCNRKHFPEKAKATAGRADNK